MGEANRKQKPSKPKDKRKVPPKKMIDPKLEDNVLYGENRDKKTII